MKAYAIVIRGNRISEEGFNKLENSSETVGNQFKINRFDATTPEQVDHYLIDNNIEWNWPHQGHVIDNELNIRKIAYGGRNPKRRVACAISHFRLWKIAARGEPILILEHDAEFIEYFDPRFILENSKYNVIGINDPRGATRLPEKFYSMVRGNTEQIQPTPIIDNMQIVQGIAGGSAYIIRPEGAVKAIESVYKYGMWPNDAQLSIQVLGPNQLGVTRTFYTKVQSLTSTTATLL